MDTNDIPFDVGTENAQEEDAEYVHLDGEEVSAFNMKDEEAEGFNADTGEIVARKTEDDEVAQDPWLQSLQQEEVRIDLSCPVRFSLLLDVGHEIMSGTSSEGRNGRG